MAYLAAFFSVLPLYLLLNKKTIDRYSDSLHKQKFFNFWLRFPTGALPRPAMLVGTFFGFLSAYLTAGVGEALIQNYKDLLNSSSFLNQAFQLSFFYASFLEETIKCSLAGILLYLFAFNRVPREKSSPGVHKEYGQLQKATPFITGAVGLGFSFIENQSYLNGIPSGNLLSAAFTRGLFATTLHTAVNFGFGLGLLKAGKKDLPEKILISYLICIFWHGIFDFFALSNEPLPRFLSSVILILICVSVLKNNFSILPETRSSQLHEILPFKIDETIPPGFIIEFLRYDRMNRKLHQTVDSPFFLSPSLPSHLPPSLSSSMEFFIGKGFSESTVPLLQTEYGSRFENIYRKIFPENIYQIEIWNSSILKKEENFLSKELLTHGLDITKIEPFYLVEISKKMTQNNDHIYLSCGLAPLFGSEFWIRFPFQFRRVCLLFLHLTSIHNQSKVFKEFHATQIDPFWLQDPWYQHAAILGMPLLDPLKSSLLKQVKNEISLPIELFYLSRSEWQIIQKYGLMLFLRLLEENNQILNNNLSHPRILNF